MKPRIYSIGHSNHKIPNFLALLAENGVRCLVDVRRYPGSRRFAQFNRGSLERSLRGAGVDYLWLGEQLGAMREQPYTDFMQTDTFALGLRELVSCALLQSTALMCAELDFSGCHRRFIADRLAADGWPVFHIFGTGKLLGHQGGLL